MNIKEIWNKLSTIDVNKHTEKKGQFTYLGWNFAISTIMEHYPNVTYDFLHYTDSNGMVKDYIVAPDGSCSVECVVTINEITKKMWLAVTDFSNRPIKNPSCVDIANTKMRCLTKCIATGFGLGFYIYKGEGVPQREYEHRTDEQAQEFDDLKGHPAFDGLKKFSNDEWKKCNSVQEYEDVLVRMRSERDKFDEINQSN